MDKEEIMTIKNIAENQLSKLSEGDGAIYYLKEIVEIAEILFNDTY